MDKNKRLLVLENIRKSQRNLDKIEALKDAIDILEGKSNKDYISRTHIHERISAAVGMVEDELSEEELNIAKQILAMITTEPPIALPVQQGWIPIKTRQLTQEEKNEIDTECDFMYDCLLPEADQEVLVTDSYGNVEIDTFCEDEGGCYFDNNCEDVTAWMQLPDAYQE